jgi:hypothetical protein
MSLAEASSVREVYERCASHTELLKHIRVPVVKRVAHCIRSWKTRHSLATLEQAFAAHRQSILFPKPTARGAHPEQQVVVVLDAAPHTSVTTAPEHSCSSLPPPSTIPGPSAPDAAHVSQEPQFAPLALPAAVEECGAQSSAPTKEPQPQPQDDVIARLVQDVAALRGLQLQHQTPSVLRFNSIATHFRKECRLVSIFGDGRCQLYSLLQVERAMLPTAYEADELRRKLKAHLLSSYTEMEWRQRVPSDLREVMSLQQFAERYLSHDTTHLPHDSIALWQDLRQRSTDVFILNKSPQGEHVDKVPCRGAAQDAVVLLFTWEDVGHYELVTYNNVICLPRHHPFILHLDGLHDEYLAGLSKVVKRAARNGVKRTAAERENDVDVEDEYDREIGDQHEATASGFVPASAAAKKYVQLKIDGPVSWSCS